MSKETKICNICKEEKPLSDYYVKNKVSEIKGEYIYYPPYCKECTKKKSRQRQLDNHDEYIKYMKNYTKNEREKERIRHRKWRKENAEQYSQYIKKYQQENKDKIKGYNLKREMNKTHVFSDEEWILCKEFFNYECAYCGISEVDAKSQQGQYLHKEHVVHDGSNDLENCVPACKKCNSRKWKLSLNEWYNDSNKFFDENRLNKINIWLETDVYKVIKRKENKIEGII